MVRRAPERNMKCGDCGFEGSAEINDFGYDTVKHRRQYYKCPRCGSLNVDFIHPEDKIEQALRFPELCYGHSGIKHDPIEKTVRLFRPVMDPQIASYSITCWFCGWGEGGGLNASEYDRLAKLKEDIERFRATQEEQVTAP